jgi:hypothetical protein
MVVVLSLWVYYWSIIKIQKKNKENQNCNNDQKFQPQTNSNSYKSIIYFKHINTINKAWRWAWFASIKEGDLCKINFNVYYNIIFFTNSSTTNPTSSQLFSNPSFESSSLSSSEFYQFNWTIFKLLILTSKKKNINN